MATGKNISLENTLEECFQFIGGQPVKLTGLLHDVFINGTRVIAGAN